MEYYELCGCIVQGAAILAQGLLAIVGQLSFFILRNMWDTFPRLSGEI